MGERITCLCPKSSPCESDGSGELNTHNSNMIQPHWKGNVPLLHRCLMNSFSANVNLYMRRLQVRNPGRDMLILFNNSFPRLIKSSERLIKSSERLIMSSERLIKSSERVIMSSERLIKSSERVIKSSGRLIKSSEQLIMSSERLIKSSERLINSSERLIKSSERLILCRQNDL